MRMRLTSRRGITNALWIALALECAAHTAPAQTPVAGVRISGTVSDKGSHTVIAQADILFVTEGRIATSDSAGRYSFVGLPRAKRIS